MQANYHSGAFPEADITALPSEFAAVAGRIAALVAARAGESVFPADGSELSALVVRIESGPVVVAVRGGMLSVSGSPESIELFAHNLPVEESLSPGYHVHFEHAGRERFVSAESVPLVLVVGNIPDTEQKVAPDCGGITRNQGSTSHLPPRR